MADGSIMIETKLSTDKFDKQIANLEEKIAKKEKQKMKIDTDIENIKKSETEFDALSDKWDDYKTKIKEANQEIKLYSMLQSKYVDPKGKRNNQHS